MEGLRFSLQVFSIHAALMAQLFNLLAMLQPLLLNRFSFYTVIHALKNQIKLNELWLYSSVDGRYTKLHIEVRLFNMLT